MKISHFLNALSSVRSHKPGTALAAGALAAGLLLGTSMAQAGVQVFVTSLSYDGNFPGLAGADTACTTAATNANLPGDWTAWLSDGPTDAVDRILDAEYQLLDGTVVANNKADLTDGTLDAPINQDEHGNTLSAGFIVWTATDIDGTFGLSGNCVNWTTASNANTAQTGLLDSATATWTDAGGGAPCNTTHRLYCFADQEVPVELQEFSVE